MDDYERKLLEEIRDGINILAWQKSGFKKNDGIEKILGLTVQRMEFAVVDAYDEINNRGYEVDSDLHLLLKQLPLAFEAQREAGKNNREIVRDLTKLIKERKLPS